MDVGVTEEHVVVGDLSFDHWVDARVPALLRFAYLVTGSQHAAEDAVQSALTRACERWSRVRRTTDPDAYVRRMVVNAHTSRWRAWRRRVSPVEQVADVAVADRSGPEHDERQRIWDACRALPEIHRTAVVLRFYEQLEYAEIAALTGVREGSVRARVSRGLAALREEMGERDE